jgi:hypothetical protein
VLVNRRRVWFIASALIGLVLACENALVPSEVIELSTEVTPSVLAAGDTVILRAIMRNPTSEAIETGLSCGPPVLFELRGDGGEVVHPLSLDGVWTCPLLDYHLLEPHETDTVVARWRVELNPAQWAVRSGFRNGARLERLSRPVNLTVR